MTHGAEAEAEALHGKVRLFAKEAWSDDLKGDLPHAQFEALALEIAAFQMKHCETVGRRAAHPTQVPSSLDPLPTIPSDAFRLTRVACHPPELDCATFRTSGTSLKLTGEHCMRTLGTYRALSTQLGRAALLGEARRATVVALLPALYDTPHSSLATMCGFFMEEFDGRSLPDEDQNALYSRRASRWLVSPSGIDVAGLHRAAAVALERNEPLLILATSLSLALLLQTLGSERITVPHSSVVMQTGGSKGRSHEVDPEALRTQVARLLNIEESQIIGEYGMTELSSQLYEGTLWQQNASPGVYFAPPWLQVTPLHPVTLRPVAEGEAGLAHFVDLANVDSAVAVLTRDLIRREDEGIRLLGRQPNSPLRGCSLLIEPLL